MFNHQEYKRQRDPWKPKANPIKHNKVKDNHKKITRMLYVKLCKTLGDNIALTIEPSRFEFVLKVDIKGFKRNHDVMSIRSNSMFVEIQQKMERRGIPEHKWDNILGTSSASSEVIQSYADFVVKRLEYRLADGNYSKETLDDIRKYEMKAKLKKIKSL